MKIKGSQSNSTNINTNEKIFEIIDDSEVKNNNNNKKIDNNNKNINENNSECTKEEISNFNQTLFNYKEYKPLKRKIIKENNHSKKIRKNNSNWIKKDSKDKTKSEKEKEKDENVIEILSNSSKSSQDHFSSIEEELKNISKKDKKLLHIIKEENELSDNKINKINKNEITKIPTPSSESSISSLEFNSRVQSKNKQNNFNNNLQNNPNKITNPITKYQEFLMFKNPNSNKIISEEKEKINSKIQQRNSLINDINNQMDNLSKEESENMINHDNNLLNNYQLNIKSLEEPTYDEFYKLKHNDNKNRRSFPFNKNIKIKKNNNIIENSRKRKDREKMEGHKCEQCQKFYDIMGENGDKFCEECSRHRTNNNVNYTPKSFYDLSF